MFVCPLSYLNRVQVYNCVYRVQFECVALRLNVYECVIVIKDSILCHTTTHSDATAGINSNKKITKNGQKPPKKAIFGPKNSIFDLKTQKPPKTPSEASK